MQAASFRVRPHQRQPVHGVTHRHHDPRHRLPARAGRHRLRADIPLSGAIRGGARRDTGPHRQAESRRHAGDVQGGGRRPDRARRRRHHHELRLPGLPAPGTGGALPRADRHLQPAADPAGAKHAAARQARRRADRRQGGADGRSFPLGRRRDRSAGGRHAAQRHLPPQQHAPASPWWTARRRSRRCWAWPRNC